MSFGAGPGGGMDEYQRLMAEREGAAKKKRMVFGLIAIAAVGGIGYYILYNSRSYHHNEAFVGVLLLAAFGVGFELLVNWSTRRFMPWYRRDEKAT